MIIQDLIGRKFRRNKYGLSTWEDTVKNVYVHLDFINPPDKAPKSPSTNLREWIRDWSKRREEAGKEGYKVLVYVVENNSPNSFSIDEIIVY